MSANVMKDEIYKYLTEADPRFIGLVYGMVQADKEEKIAKDLFSKYDSNDMIERAMASKEDIKYDRTTKIEDFKTEIENWKTNRRTK
jgi:hypothetical protein